VRVHLLMSDVGFTPIMVPPSSPLLQLMRDVLPPDAPKKPTVFRVALMDDLLPVLPVPLPYLRPIADTVDGITEALRTTHVARTSGVGGALRRRPKWRGSVTRKGAQECRNVRQNERVVCPTSTTTEDMNSERAKGCPRASDVVDL